MSYRQGGKRVFDVVVAAVLLAVLWPILLIAAIVTAWAHRGSPFFTQIRPGLGGKPFRILKLRSMRDAFGADGEPLPDHERTTRVGKALRNSSLDELPELINVLRGDMSLVGPRPLLPEYLPRYSREQARRHDVRPGITGLAQVNGRNAISWDEKFEYDIEYVDGLSLVTDLRILALTALRVLRPSGVNASEQETMPEFLGPGLQGGSETYQTPRYGAAAECQADERPQDDGRSR